MIIVFLCKHSVTKERKNTTMSVVAEGSADIFAVLFGSKNDVDSVSHVTDKVVTIEDVSFKTICFLRDHESNHHLLRDFIIEHLGGVVHGPLTESETYMMREPLWSLRHVVSMDTAAHLLKSISMLYFPFMHYKIDPFLDGFMDHYSHTMFSFWTQPTLKDVCLDGFGDYRKDLAKLVASATPDVLNWLHLFSDYLTTDQLVRAFRYMSDKNLFCEWYMSADSATVIDDLMNKVVTHPNDRYALVTRGIKEHDDPVFFDFINLDEFMVDTRVRSWQEIVNLNQYGYSYLYEKDDPKYYLQIESTDKFSALDGAEVSGYSMSVLRSYHDFVTVGDEMDVCVANKASYYNDVVNGDGVLIQFKKNDKSVLGYFVKRTNDAGEQVVRVSELRGVHNAIAPEDLDVSDLVDGPLRSLLCSDATSAHT